MYTQLTPKWAGDGYLTNYDGATAARLEVDSVGRYGRIAHTLLRQRNDL
jgi:hypothetical protein